MIGLDISNHQKGIRLANLPRQDVYIFKASQGSQYPDAYFDGFVQQALDLGARKIGAYWWLESHEPVQQQHTVFMRKIAPWLERGIPLVPIMDWEPKDPSRVDIATDGMRRLKASLGGDDMPPQIYMNHGVANRFRWQPIRDLGCRLWLAHYGANNGQRNAMPTPSGWEGKVMGHQYTDRGRLPGWGGNLDLNHFDWWPEAPRKDSPVSITIPTIRENDAKVWIDTPRSGKRKGGWGCICMKMTLPLVEAEMKRRGLIKEAIDVYQFGYSAAGANSLDTHTMGGVIDVVQGISREEREVWAMFGWMMAPRVPQWGYRNTQSSPAHGHGGMFGCVHRAASLARQVKDMMEGRNGLVSNLTVNWLKPTRTWQDAVRAHYSGVAQPQAITINNDPEGNDDMPASKETYSKFEHAGLNWQLVPNEDTAVPAQKEAQVITVSARVAGPAGAKLKTRWVSWDNKARRFTRYGITDHGTNEGETNIQVAQGGGDADLRLDVLSDKPGPVSVHQVAFIWKK